MKDKYFLFLIFFLAVGCRLPEKGLKVIQLKCEYKDSPLGIQTSSPHLSWQLSSELKGVEQTAYRVLVSDNLKSLRAGDGNIWTSDKIYSDSSIQIEYKGRPLKPAKTYYWKVQVWDNKKDSAWSETSYWQTGLFTQSDWKEAQWIAYNRLPDSNKALPGQPYNKHKQWNDTLPLLRKIFSIPKNIKRATAFISGLGQFELYLNGEKVGDHFMDPGWTQYEKEALYVTFDITDELNKGENALGVMLGNGFYYIPVWQHRYRKLTVKYGYPKVICLVKLEYTDGTSAYVKTDDSWKAAPGPVTYSSIYGGEDYNANLAQEGWAETDFNDDNWRTAVVVEGPPELYAQITDPIKVVRKFSPTKIYRLDDSSWVYDLGQNAAGIPKITVKGHKGDSLKIIPAEVVNEQGVPSQKASGGPFYYTYILKGMGEESWKPRFTYYGYRYLKVVGGVPVTEPNPADLPVITNIQGLHTRNAARKIGGFSCSNQLFNQTYQLIDWAIQNNMMSLFTDCPHREKLGWLEQMNLMGPSVHFTYDIANLFRRTVKNMKAAQTSEGLVPEIAPEYTQFGGDFRDSPEWGSSSIIVPWFMYKWFGDKRVLKHSYDMMQKYITYLGNKARDNILYFGLSDWYDLGPERPGFSQLTPDGVTATAYYYYDLNLMAQIARLLNQQEDAHHYTALAQKVKEAFNRTFFHADTKEYASGSQTANAIAVYMNLVPAQYKGDVINNIVEDIKQHNTSFTTGDIGFRYLLKVLEQAGKSGLIFKMNNRTDVPGYGYQIKKGATALTESWLGSSSASNNHFMLGHLMEWFYAGIGGIGQTDSSIAYKQVKIAPKIVGDITAANTHFESPYGRISSKWSLDGKRFNISVSIPANSSAILILPFKPNQKVSAGGKTLSENKYVHLVKKVNGKIFIRTGSGKYNFKIE